MPPLCFCTARVWCTCCMKLHPPGQVCLAHLPIPTSKAWQTTCRSKVWKRVREGRCKCSLITWHVKIWCGWGGMFLCFVTALRCHICSPFCGYRPSSKINNGPGRESQECPMSPCPGSLYWYMCVHLLTRVWLFVTPWTVALHPPLSMGFLTQEYWSGLPLPSLGNLLNLGIELTSLASPTLAYTHIYHACAMIHISKYI